MRCARRVGLFGVACLCLCLAPRPARADAAQARAHFDRGRALFEVDEYRKAIGEFKAAHIEKPDAAFLYNIAECHRRLGELPEALQFYRRFLATAPADDKTRSVVEQRVADLKTVADEPKAAPADTPPTTGGEDLSLGAPSLPDLPPTLVQSPAPASRAASSFYTRPWFLITVGAVIVASAVGIWALSHTPEPPDTALGNQSVF
jgi:tetratricopeptide (TPR) repeat protein